MPTAPKIDNPNHSSQTGMNNDTGNRLLLMCVEDLISRPVITIDNHSTIRQAAQRMSVESVSALPVIRSDQPDQLLGILTDKDLRERCIAAGVDFDQAVDKIMTPKVISVPGHTSAFEAMMLMTRKRIHHLPICDDTLKGMISLSDFVRAEGKNPAYISSAIRKANSVDAIAQFSQQIPDLQCQLAHMGASAAQIGNSVSAITTAITRRLIELAEQKFGEPPVPYAWVAAGSQARREQTSHSDQDNGLIFDDTATTADLAWFEKLANFVCDGLNEAGFVYCPGDVMAKTEKWRQNRSAWQTYFDEWIGKPEPMALMYSSIFFDLRAIHGEKSLLRRIRQRMLSLTPRQTLFRGLLAQNALKLKPPLGLIRDFVLETHGGKKDTLDLKHYGIMPIVDLARIYALSEGIAAVNTLERLKMAAGTASLSREGAADLIDAYRFLADLRIAHQVRQLENGQPADNFIPVSALSSLQREHMKDAFKVIQAMQKHLKMRY